MNIEPIAKIYTDFPTKFGIPRQPGLVEELEGKIVFEKEYADPEAVRGLEGFSHIWLIWQFSKNLREGSAWSPTVRPPRLGGNRRVGVFASRSPFRPNNLGLSCVKLLRICDEPGSGRVIYVSGADMVSGTPIYDIKPYLPYSDCVEAAAEGFAPLPEERLQVVFENGGGDFPAEKLETLEKVLSLDPRPRYQRDGREYVMPFGGFDICFRVEKGILKVEQIRKTEKEINCGKEEP